nr:protein lines [Leptinotarsa decemlineata]
MVLRQRYITMSSEQPLKKKLRREDESDNSDETDFINNLAENSVPTNLQALHLSLHASFNEDDISRNALNLQLNREKVVFRTSESATDEGEEVILGSNEEHDNISCSSLSKSNESVSENILIEPAPSIVTSTSTVSNSKYLSLSNSFSSSSETLVRTSSSSIRATNHERYNSTYAHSDHELQIFGLDDFQNQLVKQCLCNVPEVVLRKPFEGQQVIDSSAVGSAMLSEWPSKKVLQFLSNLQLLFDVYLKQNNKGFICSRIVTICETIIGNEYNLIEQIISLCETRNKYVNYLAARVFSSFLIIAKTNINNEWLETIVNFFTTENIDYVKMQFALEVIKRVVEWKDVELHVLEEVEPQDTLQNSTTEEVNSSCSTVPFSDPESYDTSAIKGLIIKSLESKWPELIYRVQNLILHNSSVQSQTCILTFLALWESTISVKANLSVIDTKPFYAHLEIFVSMLNSQLPPVVWKQLLSLFNEVLCYGSTLALQDMLPDDTCQLAHLIVRYVKDYRLLDSLPFKRNEGLTVNSFVGTIASSQPAQTNIDKTLLQKMALLVLKSVAITIKETRSDSSDSSVGSDDSDFYQDMQVIERSIRDVLKKLDVFVKNSLEFHPETPFSKILIHLFSDQDDYMIEAMVCSLDITIGISYRNAVFPDLINMLNPIHSFIEFLNIVSHDSDILLDYLVSNETCFLLYLLRFLKYTKRNWAKFISSCGEGSAPRGNELDNTMTVLIRLKMQISRLVSKDLFPYNVTPIMRLLETCENLYEGNEFS